MKANTAIPLENTKFPNWSTVQSFMEISHNFLKNQLHCTTLPYNRMVKINYNDGSITSNEICSAIMHSCRKFGIVALVESEINFLTNSYDDVISLTYNRVMKKDFALDLANPISSIIIKDYESNRLIYGEDMESEIKTSFRSLNLRTVYNGESFIEQRNLYPCFFLIN
jgi:hypothetical protein